MTIINRGASALLALLAGGACSRETINILTSSGDDGEMRPGIDAAIDGAAVPPDATAPPDAPNIADAGSGCPELIDQRLGDCLSPPVTQCDGYSTATTSGSADAQVFTPVIGGAVTGLRLRMRSSDPLHNRVVVAIADLRGDPLALLDPSYSIDGHVLATTLTTMTGEFAWQPVVFSSPPTVLPGRPYAIYVRVGSTIPGGNGSVDWGAYNDYDHPTLDAYPGGKSFGTLSTGQWIANAVFQDLMFEVRVVPASCP